MATVDIDLIANTQKALKSVKTFSSQATKAVSSVSDSFFNLRNVAIGALAGIGIGKFVRDSVAAAAQQEQAVQQLNTALALTGELTEENTQDFLDFASALQANSTVGDEVSLSLIGLSKSFGATNEQAKLILETAANLSAVTGESLESSVRNLSKTLGGLKGELGETQPELRELTQEQLRNGDAITILAQKYNGAAKALTKTFSGAVQQTQNSFGDLLEEIGFFITQNPAVIAAINLASEVFNDLGEAISSNRESVEGLVRDGLLAFTDSIPFLIRLTGNFVVGLKTVKTTLDIIQLGLASTALKAAQAFDAILKAASILVSGAFLPVLKAIEGVAKGLEIIGLETNAERFETFSKDVTDSVFEVGNSLDGVIDTLTEFRDESRVKLGESTDEIKDTVEAFENVALKAETFSTKLKILTEEAETSGRALKNLSKANQQVGDTAIEAASQVEGLFMGSVRSGFGGGVSLSVVPTVDFSEIEDTDPIQIGVAPDLTGTNLENELSVLLDASNILPNPNTQRTFEVSAENQKKAAEEQVKATEAAQRAAEKESERQKELTERISGVGVSILSGAEGARKFLVDGAAIAADAFLPGLGAAIGPLVSALSQGPEFVKQQVEEFAEALPILIENIAGAVPVLIEAVAANADKIIIALLRAIPLVAESLLRAFLEKIDESFGTDFAIPFDESIEKWEGATEDLQEKYLSSVEDGSQRILANFQNGLNQFTSTFERFGNSIINGIKTAVTEASAQFSSSIGSALESFVIGFRDGLTNIFETIGIPPAFEDFLAQLFAFKFPSTDELTSSISNAFTDGAAQLGQFASGFIDALSGLVNNLTGLDNLKIDFDFDRLSSAITSPFEPILEFFRNLKIDLPEISLPGGGGGGGVLGQVSSSFGFADGGRVPDGFPNDTFPARLSSGEEVFDTSTSQLLRDFLADQSGGGEGQNVQINLQIGEKQLADVMINLNRQGFRLAP